jgi:hypothetical protein
MKKLLAISIVLVLLGPAVFAEVAVSAGVHGVFVPIEIEAIENADDSITAGQIIGWGSDRARIAQITFAGESEDGKVGFKTQLNVNESYANGQVVDSNGNPVATLQGDLISVNLSQPVTLDDWAGVWIKPIDQFRLTLGRFQQDDLRGAVGDHNGWALAAQPADGEDNIFSRFTGNIGALVDVYPVEGLGLHLLIPGLETTSYAAGTQAGRKAYEIYERFQLALSYKVGGIGLARIQYLNSTADHWNNRDGDFATGRRVEAAFKVTSIEGLTIDIGVKIPFRYKITTINEAVDYALGSDDVAPYVGNYAPSGTLETIAVYAQQPYQASVGVNGSFGAIGIWTRLDTFFLGSTRVEVPYVIKYAKIPQPFIAKFAVEPTYDLGFGVVGIYYAFQAASNYKAKIKYDDLIAPFAPILGLPTEVEVGGGGEHGFGAFFKIPIGGGALKPGVAYRFGHDKAESYYGTRNGIFSIPIEFDFSF